VKTFARFNVITISFSKSLKDTLVDSFLKKKTHIYPDFIFGIFFFITAYPRRFNVFRATAFLATFAETTKEKRDDVVLFFLSKKTRRVKKGEGNVLLPEKVFGNELRWIFCFLGNTISSI
tara:strand:- start:1014 stop:1373 length:360 start_codon:yes stop_codon:yes gene_type:complete